MGCTSSEAPSSESAKNVTTRVDLPKSGCMPPYCPGWKFAFDGNIVIVSEITPRKINFILQDMGASNISGKMLKNSHGDEKTKTSV